MPGIGLTDYVKPKNAAFTGIVQAKEVLGGGGDGTLPDACVAESNVTQHQAAVVTTAAVNTAGATMNSDTDVSSTSWVLDEDTMSSDSATKVPTQQSVKAYVDSQSATVLFDKWFPARDFLETANPPKLKKHSTSGEYWWVFVDGEAAHVFAPLAYIPAFTGSSTLKADVVYAMDGSESSKNVKVTVTVCVVTTGDTWPPTTVSGGANNSTYTVHDTADELAIETITLSNRDSFASGYFFTLKVEFDRTTTTATADLKLAGVRVYEVSA